MIDKVLLKFIWSGKWGAGSSVKLAIDILKEVTISGYIPFTSPTPSSTEKEIRDSIRDAIRNPDVALELMETLYGKAPKKNIDRRRMVEERPLNERDVVNPYKPNI